MSNLMTNEIKIQHGFKSITIDLDSEKTKTLESFLKKYKDNLFISVPLTSLMITESETNKSVTVTDEVIGGSFYVVNLRHDAKGCV